MARLRDLPRAFKETLESDPWYAFAVYSWVLFDLYLCWFPPS